MYRQALKKMVREAVKVLASALYQLDRRISHKAVAIIKEAEAGILELIDGLEIVKVNKPKQLPKVVKGKPAKKVVKPAKVEKEPVKENVEVAAEVTPAPKKRKSKSGKSTKKAGK